MSGVRLQFVALDQDVKDRIARDAAESDASMNDLVVGVLARHYGVEFEPTGRNGTPPPGPSPKVVLRMPEKLWRKLHQDSFRRATPKRVIIHDLLIAHYGLSAAIAER